MAMEEVMDMFIITIMEGLAIMEEFIMFITVDSMEDTVDFVEEGVVDKMILISFIYHKFCQHHHGYLVITSLLQLVQYLALFGLVR